MKRILGLGVVLAVLALIAGGGSGCGGGSDPGTATNSPIIVTNITPAATLTGSWNGNLSLDGAISMHLTQTGDALSGTVTISGSTVGATGGISGDTVTLTATLGTTVYTLTGNANSSRTNIAGNYIATVPVGPPASGTWSANK